MDERADGDRKGKCDVLQLVENDTSISLNKHVVNSISVSSMYCQHKHCCFVRWQGETKFVMKVNEQSYLTG